MAKRKYSDETETTETVKTTEEINSSNTNDSLNLALREKEHQIKLLENEKVELNIRLDSSIKNINADAEIIKEKNLKIEELEKEKSALNKRLDFFLNREKENESLIKEKDDIIQKLGTSLKNISTKEDETTSEISYLFKVNDIVMVPNQYSNMKFKVLSRKGIDSVTGPLYELISLDGEMSLEYAKERDLKS